MSIDDLVKDQRDYRDHELELAVTYVAAFQDGSLKGLRLVEHSYPGWPVIAQTDLEWNGEVICRVVTAVDGYKIVTHAERLY